MGREVGQGKMKYLKIPCSYVLKYTSYLGLAVSAVGLDLSSPAHAVLPLLVIITEWHNQPHFTLLSTMQHLRPPTLPLTTTTVLGTGARNAMNLVCRTSKVREKTDLGAWGRTQAQPGDWGRLSGCLSQIKEIREKTDFRGRERVNEREGGALDYLLVKGLDLGLHI